MGENKAAGRQYSKNHFQNLAHNIFRSTHQNSCSWFNPLHPHRSAAANSERPHPALSRSFDAAAATSLYDTDASSSAAIAAANALNRSYDLPPLLSPSPQRTRVSLQSLLASTDTARPYPLSSSNHSSPTKYVGKSNDDDVALRIHQIPAPTRLNCWCTKTLTFASNHQFTSLSSGTATPLCRRHPAGEAATAAQSSLAARKTLPCLRPSPRRPLSLHTHLSSSSSSSSRVRLCGKTAAVVTPIRTPSLFLTLRRSRWCR